VIRAIIALASSAGILLLNVVTGILVARMLGPEHRGLLASAVSICTLAAGITSWSIADVLGRSIAASNDRKFDILGPYAVMMAVGTAIGLLLVLGFEYFDFLFLPGAETLLMKGLILIIPFTHVSQLAMGLLQGNHLWNKWNLVRISPHFAYLVALLVVLMGKAGLDTVSIAFTASNAVPVLLSLYFARGTAVERIGTSWREIAETIRSTGQIHFGRLLQMTRQNIDKILIPLTFSAETLGFYVVAVTLASPLMAGATTISSVYIPRITDELRSENLSQRRRTLLEMIGIGIVSLIFAAAYSMLAEPLVTFLFGASFAPAKAMLPLTVAATAGTCVSKLVEAYLIALNRTRAIKFIEAIPVISVALGLWAFPEDFHSFLIVLTVSAWITALIYLFFLMWFRRALL